MRLPLGVLRDFTLRQPGINFLINSTARRASSSLESVLIESVTLPGCPSWITSIRTRTSSLNRTVIMKPLLENELIYLVAARWCHANCKRFKATLNLGHLNSKLNHFVKNCLPYHFLVTSFFSDLSNSQDLWNVVLIKI